VYQAKSVYGRGIGGKKGYLYQGCTRQKSGLVQPQVLVGEGFEDFVPCTRGRQNLIYVKEENGIFYNCSPYFKKSLVHGTRTARSVTG
jgi:hypothetical protein